MASLLVVCAFGATRGAEAGWDGVAEGAAARLRGWQDAARCPIYCSQLEVRGDEIAQKTNCGINCTESEVPGTVLSGTLRRHIWLPMTSGDAWPELHLQREGFWKNGVRSVYPAGANWFCTCADECGLEVKPELACPPAPPPSSPPPPPPLPQWCPGNEPVPLSCKPGVDPASLPVCSDRDCFDFECLDDHYLRCNLRGCGFGERDYCDASWPWSDEPFAPSISYTLHRVAASILVLAIALCCCSRRARWRRGGGEPPAVRPSPSEPNAAVAAAPIAFPENTLESAVAVAVAPAAVGRGQAPSSGPPPSYGVAIGVPVPPGELEQKLAHGVRP